MSDEPLAGVRVVDFSELLPGPFLTQNLVELGATVIKVERPGGDPARAMAPGLHAACNRGKQALRLDLKSEDGKAAARDLVRGADVLVEGFRPEVMSRFGLGPERLCAEHPGLVYASLSGFGSTGPKRNLPGHDITYAADAGVLALAGVPGQSPTWGPGVPVADLAASAYGLSGILAALLRAQSTGRGAHLDISIRGSLAHWLNPRLGDFYAAGLVDLDSQRSAALVRAAYGVFSCRDGVLVAIAALEDHFWAALVDALELREWDGPEWTTSQDRRAAAPRINSAIATVLARCDSEEVLSVLNAAGVPASVIRSPREALADTDPVLVDHESALGPFLRFPVRVRATPLL
ncbi:CaiB/BaiF CoA transferase family protein [Cumulibacter manganitolerans]|uniref:CaiB/BaiF CoA transferase family protein n=1 Tax=Cumulibacter manganitolerans TaxID=1884992 RepID=UPI001294D7F7|nr:CoA transferase [Cumulibacter manganitolerans]